MFHRLIRHLTHGNVVFGFIPDIWRIAKKYHIDHFIIDFVNSGDFPVKSVWKRILKKNVKDSSKHRRAITCNEKFNAKVDTFFQLSNKDNFWGTVRKNLNVAKYCYSAIRLLGYSVSSQFPYRCKHCDKLSDSYVTHVIWFCEKTENIRQELICEIYFALGTRPFQQFIGSPLTCSVQTVSTYCYTHRKWDIC